MVLTPMLLLDVYMLLKPPNSEFKNIIGFAYFFSFLIMELELENVVYPLSRYSHSIDYRLYHVYRSTPAQDFLHNCTGESVREPAVLALGCGDISSCFYSLWKILMQMDCPGLMGFISL